MAPHKGKTIPDQEEYYFFDNEASWCKINNSGVSNMVLCMFNVSGHKDAHRSDDDAQHTRGLRPRRLTFTCLVQCSCNKTEII